MEPIEMPERERSQCDQKEPVMAGKDKGGRSKKTAASKTPKEKRQAKRDKKANANASSIPDGRS